MNMESPKPALFSYTGDNDNPADVIHQVADGLRAFALIFQFREPPVMGEQDLTGICDLLHGFTKSLDSVAEHLGEQRAAAAQKQFIDAAAEYRRGQREAADQLVALINSEPTALAARAAFLACRWRDGA